MSDPATDPMAEAQAIDAQYALAQQDQVAQALPPAAEPLQPGVVNPLVDMVMAALAVLAPDVPMPAPETMYIQEPVDALPSTLASAIVGVFGMFMSPEAPPEAAKYFANEDPALLVSTNSGLQRLGQLFSLMAGDQHLAKALTTPMEVRRGNDIA